MIPATYVIIDSHSSECQLRIVISEELRGDMRSKWEEPSAFISRLNHIPWIGPHLAWSELDRAQLQSLVAAHLTIRNEGASKDDDLIMTGLYTCLTALVVKLEEDTGWVSTLRINHLGPLHIEADVSMTIGVKVEPMDAPDPPKPRFRVVVNNDA